MWRAFRSLTNSLGYQQVGSSHYRLVSASATSKDKSDPVENASNSPYGSDPICVDNNTDLEVNFQANLRFNESPVKRQLTDIKKSFIASKTDNILPTNLSLKNILSKDSEKLEVHSVSGHSRNSLLATVSEALGNSSIKSVEPFLNESKKNDTEPQASDISEEFGTLADSSHHEEYVGDDVDIKSEKAVIPNHSERREINYYATKMRQLISQGKLKEAIAVIEQEMPAVRAWPDLYCYRVIIRGCATVGDTRKAFSFYNQLKKRGLTPNARIWAQLFVACGHSHSQEDGLLRATKLRRQLKEGGSPLTDEVYHTMIRAFGRSGDVDTAFEVMDDMVANKLPATTTAFNSLLHACLFDKQAGFRHAVMVWRRMRLMRCSPDLYSYNLMVRCTQCGAGDPALLAELLHSATKQPEQVRQESQRRQEQLLRDREQRRQERSSAQHRPHITVDFTNNKVVVEKKIAAADTPKVEAGSDHVETSGIRKKFFPSAERGTGSAGSEWDGQQDCSASVVASADAALMPPNILAEQPSPGAVLRLTALDTPTDRLAVVGGSAGVLQQMQQDGVQPDIKTFSLLLAALPRSVDSEEALLRSMAAVGLEPDITFCNLLIRRRITSKHRDTYQMALSLLAQYRLLPNIMTYGCLALGCRTLPDARTLLADMDKSGLCPNLTIMKSLVGCALRSNRYFYALEMLRATHQFQLQPDEQMLRELEERGREGAKKDIRRLDRLRESGAKLSGADFAHLQSCHTFLLEYRQWLQNSTVRRKEMPWAYRSEAPPLEQDVHG